MNSKNLKVTKGKPRLDLLPFKVLMKVAEVFAFGAEKYEAWNWTKAETQGGIAPHIVYGRAAIGHFMRFVDPTEPDVDSESGLSHAAHGVTSGMISLWHWLMREDAGEAEKVDGAGEGMSKTQSCDWTIARPELNRKAEIELTNGTACIGLVSHIHEGGFWIEAENGSKQFVHHSSVKRWRYVTEE